VQFRDELECLLIIGSRRSGSIRYLFDEIAHILQQSRIIRKRLRLLRDFHHVCAAPRNCLNDFGPPGHLFW
jgi:hypothetical protein